MKLGIIGGSGLYELNDLKRVREIRVKTPFGAPSDAYIAGRLGDVEVFFLPRHGRGHRILPSEINHRANIFGFKKLGVSTVIGVSAVGSLREDLRPRDIVLPDQYFDRTKKSLEHTFFGNGLVAHVAFSQPVCSRLREAMHAVVDEVISKHKCYHGLQVRDRGTYINMEGPAFSTKAESLVYRQLGFDVIGMTSLPEAKLCREAEICYASLSMITDYDCWYVSVEPVSVEMIMENLAENAKLAHDLIRNIALRTKDDPKCSCRHALRDSIVTAPECIPAKVKKALAPIVGKYVS